MEFMSETKTDDRVERLRAMMPTPCKITLSGYREAMDPHAPMVGPQHVTHASDRHGGMLEPCECGPPCCRPTDQRAQCGMKMGDHRKVDVLIVTVDEECGEGELYALLMLLKAEIALAEMGFEGFAFLGDRAKVDASLAASAKKEEAR